MAEEGTDDGDQQGAQERRPEALDPQRRDQRDQVEHERVDHESEETERENIEGQGEQENDRPDERVHNPEHQRGHNRARKIWNTQPVDNPRREIDRDGVEDHTQYKPFHLGSPPAGPSVARPTHSGLLRFAI